MQCSLPAYTIYMNIIWNRSQSAPIESKLCILQVNRFWSESRAYVDVTFGPFLFRRIHRAQ